MMMKPANKGNGKIWIFIIISLVAVLCLPAQNQKVKLQEKKARLEQEINNTNKLLNQTQKNKEYNLNQLYLINKKINHREELIQTIGSEVNSLDSQLGSLSDTISRLSRSLENLKLEYARLIYSTFKNRNAYSRLMFIFSSRNFSQAYKRLKYLQVYSEYRKSQATSILSTQSLLGKKKLELERQKSSKLSLRQKQELEKSQLASEKLEKDNSLKKLTKQEKNLLRKLKENEAALSKLQRAIESLIAEEIRKANEEKSRKAAEKALAKTSGESSKSGSSGKGTGTSGKTASPATPSGSSNSMAANAEEVALSNSFAGNKGRLPWPVQQGTIAATFGEHAHQEFKNIKVKNNGIDISVAPGSAARAVFEGVVSSVMSIANLHYVVIVRHGDYLSVYSNLDKVSVKKGDKVRTRQNIGTVFTDPEIEKTLLHFEIWHGAIMQNPQLWIGS